MRSTLLDAHTSNLGRGLFVPCEIHGMHGPFFRGLGLDSGGRGGRRGIGAVATIVKCQKCFLQKKITECQQRNSGFTCTADINAYNSLQKRWLKQANLKTWWQKMTVDKQAEWYIKWQRISNNASKFDNTFYQEVQRALAYSFVVQ